MMVIGKSKQLSPTLDEENPTYGNSGTDVALLKVFGADRDGEEFLFVS
jgi:hypothetical protein